jgi:hypothetical protein
MAEQIPLTSAISFRICRRSKLPYLQIEVAAEEEVQTDLRISYAVGTQRKKSQSGTVI